MTIKNCDRFFDYWIFSKTNFSRHINTAKDQLPTIEATIKLGMVPKQGENVLGFEPMVNQRLLPPTFPRYTEIRTTEATYEYLHKLLQRLIAATHVSQLTTYLSALVSFTIKLLTFQEKWRIFSYLHLHWGEMFLNNFWVRRWNIMFYAVQKLLKIVVHF